MFHPKNRPQTWVPASGSWGGGGEGVYCISVYFPFANTVHVHRENRVFNLAFKGSTHLKSRPPRKEGWMGRCDMRPNPKPLTGDKVDSGIGLAMVNVLVSTKGEIIVNSGIGSHAPWFSLDSASAPTPKQTKKLGISNRIRTLQQKLTIMLFSITCLVYSCSVSPPPPYRHDHKHVSLVGLISRQYSGR